MSPATGLTTPRTHELRTTVPYPAADVWDWHTRPGAVVRLTPGAARMRVTGEADSLRDGTTTFRLPGRPALGRPPRSRRLPGGAPVHRRVRQPAGEPHRLAPRTPHRPGRRHRHRHRHNQHRHRPDHRARPRRPAAPHRRLPGPAAHRRPRPPRRPAGPRHPARTIAVTGPTGLVGTRLVALLRTAGHTVIPLSRHEVPGGRRWNPAAPDPDLLTGVDTVIHLAGAPIFGRFTDAHRAAVRDSRVGPTRRLADLAATSGVTTFVSASAVGFYGARRPEPVGEDAPRGDGFLADVVSDWEADCDPARQAGLRVVTIRTGLVLAGGSPLLTLLAASSRAGGGRLGAGTQHFPWIGIDDLTDIYHRAAVDPTLSGPVNAVAPEDITEAEFAATLADLQRVRVPLRIPVPAAGPTDPAGRPRRRRTRTGRPARPPGRAGTRRPPVPHHHRGRPAPPRTRVTAGIGSVAATGRAPVPLTANRSDAPRGARGGKVCP
jgi:uncharacterized protein (TIGR01777 family)